ncbi:MAG: FRG domain-containing protein [Lawsonibacter sp.]|jgi:hypothetical protein|nr:FRG domain-containing protein [Lawsonibacter sp.]
MRQPDFNLLDWPVMLPDEEWHRETQVDQIPEVEWNVRSGDKLWKTLGAIQNQYRPYKGKFPIHLWYRGHEDEAFVLLPSIIRYYFKRNIMSSLPVYQKTLLEHFLARSQGAIELHNEVLKRDNEQIEYIADMQHYSVPTSLMDWSDDLGIAFYFATAQTTGINRASINAAIYVFQPYIYNSVRKELIAKYANTEDEYDDYNHKTAAQKGILPNFSAHFNLVDPCFRDFIIGPPKPYKCIAREESWRAVNPISVSGREIFRNEAPYLPLAIQVPRSNIRVQKQSGNFLAFNLCERPLQMSVRTDQRYLGFEHVELSKVQEFYFNNSEFRAYLQTLVDDGGLITAMKKRVPFLHKMVIESSALEEVRMYAQALGKRKDSVYPELYHIGEDIATGVVL